MFSLGGSEILIVVVLALLLFGPDKIPQLARTVGKFMREFNKYKDIMESTIRMEVSRTEEPDKDELTVEQRMAKAGAASTALIEKQRAEAAAASQVEGADAAATSAAAEQIPPSDAGVAPEAPRPAARPSADESDEEEQG